MTPESAPGYDSVVAGAVSCILDHFPTCGRRECALVVERVVQKAIELAKPFGVPSPKREEAKKFFEDLARHSRALQKALLDPQYAMFTRKDVPQFATIDEFGGGSVSSQDLVKMLAGLEQISLHRRSLISPGKGEFRLSDEYGFPTPCQLVAVFVVLFWQRMRGNMPDRVNSGAIEVCEEIWKCVATATQEPAEDRTFSDRWEHHLKQARKGMREINDRPAEKAKWLAKARSADPDQRAQALKNPLGEPSRQTVAFQNALQIASSILCEAALREVDKAKI